MRLYYFNTGTLQVSVYHSARILSSRTRTFIKDPRIPALDSTKPSLRSDPVWRDLLILARSIVLIQVHVPTTVNTYLHNIGDRIANWSAAVTANPIQAFFTSLAFKVSV